MLNFLKSISARNPNGGRGPEKPAVSVRERVSALRHLPAFLRLIWHTSPGLALGNIALRLLRAFLPLAITPSQCCASCWSRQLKTESCANYCGGSQSAGVDL